MLGINTNSWEVAADRDAWRHTIKLGLSQYEESPQVKVEEKRLHKKTVCLAGRPAKAFICSKCRRDCHSQIGLHSHNILGAGIWSHEIDGCQSMIFIYVSMYSLHYLFMAFGCCQFSWYDFNGGLHFMHNNHSQ